MDGIKCVNGHELPEDFHHDPQGEREPCPTCGSTSRIFPVSLKGSIELSGEGTLSTVGTTRSASWRTHSQQRPEASKTRQVESFSVECERLGSSWLVSVYDRADEWQGGGVAGDADDVGLAVALTISEAIGG